MLSGETYLFNGLATLLRATYSGIVIYGEETDAPAKFPCVTMVESDNTTHRASLTGDNKEHYVNLLYSINVYSNLQTGGKQDCQQIMETIDGFMREHGFMRTMNNPMPNIDRSISRRSARYTGILSEQGLVYKP